MESLTLKDILDLGMSGILLVQLFLLWQRLNKVTDVLIENGKQASAERAVIAKASGLNTQDLSRQAQLVRRKLNNDRTG